MLNKEVGPDEISHRMLKKARYSINKHIRILFNRSLREGNYMKA